ncbi:MAG: EFR1 family ferrodoxin [Treponema sp.]|jgi:ferredoxin|nr:EFR1 family ferrodoxin [Treponema sp.]
MTKIYYFSGTGNTLWSAKRIAELLGGDTAVFNIGAEMQKEPGALEADRLVFMFPSYAYQSPLMVRRFLIRSAIRSPYIAALVTFGTAPGGALAEVRRVLKRKKAVLSFSGSIPSVENYIPIFGPPDEQIVAKRLALQSAATEEAAKAIEAGKKNSPWPIRPFSFFVSSLFRMGTPLFVKGYKAGAECNGCGLCERICPAGAITLKNSRPEFSAKCEHCQACLNWCPRRSIRYIRLKPDTPRYHHPGITVHDLF